MASKIFRTFYITNDLDELLVERTRQEQSSFSRLIRVALRRYFESVGMIPKANNKNNT